MTTLPPIAGYLLLLGLGLFFGLAFEEFQAQTPARPGGVRTFPLLALAGGLLYRLDAAHLLPFSAGLLVLGAWLTLFYRQHIAEIDPAGQPNVGLVVLVCNVLAYLLGPVALAEPPWVAIGTTVAAVLLLTARERLHTLARGIELGEFATAGKFLILTALVLPFLPNRPVTALTDITPHQVWLAVLAVCTVSYASYLLQRYLAPPGGGIWVAVLGGLYSSTATTVVLARRASAGSEPARLYQAQTGIIVATAIMYVRMLIIVGVFNLPMATALAAPMLALAAGGLGLTAIWYRAHAAPKDGRPAQQLPENPLELSAAVIFAVLFVAISLASAWVRSRFGERGVFGLAALVGATDIDPFVLNIAAGGAAPLAIPASVAAILVAASSNNLVKAAYAVAFAGARAAAAPAAALTLLALGGLGAAWWIVVG